MIASSGKQYIFINKALKMQKYGKMLKLTKNWVTFSDIYEKLAADVHLQRWLWRRYTRRRRL